MPQLESQENQFNENTYIYEEIYRKIKKDILVHNFLPQERLPSKREISDNLGVSINSVTHAYQQLMVDGYIYSVERSGFYVNSLNGVAFSMRHHTPNNELIENYEPKENWISFSHMSADSSLFPYNEWFNCEHRAIRLNEADLEADPSNYPQGIFSVRKTIARHLLIARGVKCFPEQIVLGGGTQVLMSMILQLFPREYVYAIENPGYHRIYRLLTLAGKSVKKINLDHSGVSSSDIRNKNPNVLYTTPSHQFPTGVVMPVSRRVEVLSWAEEQKDRYIIEDDYDSDFKYEADTLPSLQGMDNCERVIYMGTFSKSLLPGLRISYMILPQHLLKKFREQQGFLMQTCNSMAQLTVKEFIDSGKYLKYVTRLKRIYSERRTKLIEELKRKFGKNITILGANAGLHFLASFNTLHSVKEIVEAAKKQKLELYSLDNYIFDHKSIADRPTFLIGFSNLPIETVSEGVKRLYKAIYA